MKAATRKFSILFLAALVLIYMFTLSAGVVSANGDYIYTEAGGEATITDYIGVGGSIDIPAELGGFPVVAIGDSAFREKSLTVVVIPDSVITIGENAFRSNALISVWLGNNVTTIGGYAFYGNPNLSSVHFPDSLTSIGDQAFYNASIASIMINNVTSMGIYAFAGNELTSVVLGSGLTTIEMGVFSDNRLTSITIPGNVTEIKMYAFRNNQLTSLIMEEGLTSIGNEAFMNNQLTSIDIPASVTALGSSAFQGNQLTTLVMPDTVMTMGINAFKDNQLTSLTISSNLTSIALGAFENNLLTSVALPGVLTSIGGSAFAHNLLTSLVIPDSVTTIYGDAFAHNQLFSVTIPASVVSLYDLPFDGNQVNPAALTIYGYAGTRAQTYALANGHTFVDLDYQEPEGWTIEKEVSHGTLSLDRGESATIVYTITTENDGSQIPAAVVDPLLRLNGTEVLWENAVGGVISLGGFEFRRVPEIEGPFSLPDVQGAVYTYELVITNVNAAYGGTFTLTNTAYLVKRDGNLEDTAEVVITTPGDLPQTGGVSFGGLGLLALIGGALSLRRKRNY